MPRKRPQSPQVVAAAAAAAAPVAKPAKSGKTVVVASKLPMSLQLQHCVFKDQQFRLRETSWTEKVGRRVGPLVIIRGTAYPNGTPPEGFRDRAEMIAGYAITRGVSADWWETWLKQNAETEMVLNNVVFAAETIDEVRQIASKELRGVRSGLDPIIPPKEGPGGTMIVEDPRLPRPIKGISFKGEPGPTDADVAA